jgi:hypothetical protein
VRARRLLAFAGYEAFGMSVPEIARALERSAQLVSDDLAEVHVQLKQQLEHLGLPASTIFRRNPPSFEQGDGI